MLFFFFIILLILLLKLYFMYLLSILKSLHKGPANLEKLPDIVSSGSQFWFDAILQIEDKMFNSAAEMIPIWLKFYSLAAVLVLFKPKQFTTAPGFFFFLTSRSKLVPAAVVGFSSGL